ncbi:MAG: C25 family cysteine peptidase [Planctomycetota bacterium]
MRCLVGAARASALLLLLLVLALAPGARADDAESYLAVGPDSLLAAAKPLLEHRAGALKVSTLSVPASIAAEALAAQIKQRQPRYVLLLGDVDRVPTFVVREAATDRPYGDWDGDGFPEAAIGRIPLDDPGAVRRVAERTIRYEREREAGLWQKQLALLANEGRFSPAIDQVIEQVFARVIKQVLPTGYDVDLTYANPRSMYCFPPRHFSARVLERLNEGALVFAYIGHGAKQSLDELEVPRESGGGVERFPVLSARDAGRLQLGRCSPVTIAIACWTACIDGQRPSLGESLLAAPQGPVAFFGASRVSHPVHNALLAKELVAELFAKHSAPVRLGPALDRARKALVRGRAGDQLRLQLVGMASLFMKKEELQGEMPRHVDMYNLLGDPALVLARPEGSIDLSAGTHPPSSYGIKVRGFVSLERKMPVRVTFETPREATARPPREGETPEERYGRANDKVLATELTVCDEKGQFEVYVRLPVEVGRKHPVVLVKAFACDGKQSAQGGLEFRFP